MPFTKADVANKQVNGEIVEIPDDEKQAIVDEWNTPPLEPTAEEIQKAADKTSAVEKLTALGLSESEVNAVEDYDPEGWFDSTTNYRFQPDEDGVYFIDACLLQGNGAGADNVAMYIYKNGAEVYSNQVYQTGGTIAPMHSSGIVSLNGSSDYIEIFTMATSGSGTLTLDANGWNATNTTECRMSAMRLI